MSLKKLKEQIAEKRAPSSRKRATPGAPSKGIGQVKTTTMPKLSPGAKKAIKKAETTEEVQAVLDTELPKGYTAIGKNDVPKLMKLKQAIIEKKIASYDYETDGDPDDEAQDPQDHQIVGVSFAYEIGQAFYMPIQHIGYGANFEVKWFVENFLKPVLEHPDVLIIAHNMQFEHAVNLLYGIDFYPKTKTRKLVDTMYFVKSLGLPETLNPGTGEVVIGLKPSTKALLADENGMVHGLLHIDDIKSFKDTVGSVVWEEPIPGEFYKSGAKKGLPKTKKMSRSRTFNELPVDKETVDYGCSDSDWALGLYYKLLPVMEAEDLLDTFFELNMPFALVLAEYELAGWRIAPERLADMEEVALIALDGGYDEETGEETEGLNEKVYRELINITSEAGMASVNELGELIVPAGSWHMGKWKKEEVFLTIKTAKPFNFGSTQHKQWLLYVVLGIDLRGIKRSKKTGLPETGGDTFNNIIEDYEGDNTFMKLMKEKAKYDKIMSTYVQGLKPYVRIDTQKIHTKLKMVQTWRLSSSKPNLQNIPRADNDPIGIRGLFSAPHYDLTADYSGQNIFTRPPEIMIAQNLSGATMYIACDYSQIELKVLAWYAMEQTMIATLANGGDLHSVVARDVFKLNCLVEEVKKLYKPHRYRAKKVNFGIVYGMTEFGLSADRKMGMTQAEAKQFILNYYATYPGIRTYAHDQIAFAREYGFVQTMFGNRRALPDINHPNEWIRKSAENKAMNTPIQGSAGNIIQRAMVALRDRIPYDAPYMRQCMQIHDELIAEVPVEYGAEGCAFIKSVMEEPIPGFSDIMPIIAEPAIGAVWQHALDVSWDANGQAYVKPKSIKKEATDVTLDEMRYALPLYEKAGIEVRLS